MYHKYYIKRVGKKGILKMNKSEYIDKINEFKEMRAKLFNSEIRNSEMWRLIYISCPPELENFKALGEEFDDRLNLSMSVGLCNYEKDLREIGDLFDRLKVETEKIKWE